MLIDSKIVIYSVIPENIKLRAFLFENKNKLCVSAITKLEVLGYNKLTFEEINLFKVFFDSINEFSIKMS